MARLEDLARGALVAGVDVRWFGGAAPGRSDRCSFATEPARGAVDDMGEFVGRAEDPE